MSAIDDMNLKFTSGNCIPVDRTVVTRDEWLAVFAEIEALRQERDALVDAIANQVAISDAAHSKNSTLMGRVYDLEQERDWLLANLPKIKAAVREACKYAVQKALDEGFFTIDSHLFQYANNIEVMAKEQGE